MKLSEFDNGMPSELIALHPAPNRDEARMMVLHRKTGEIEHRTVKDIIHYFVHLQRHASVSGQTQWQ